MARFSEILETSDLVILASSVFGEVGFCFTYYAAVLVS